MAKASASVCMAEPVRGIATAGGAGQVAWAIGHTRDGKFLTATLLRMAAGSKKGGSSTPGARDGLTHHSARPGVSRVGRRLLRPAAPGTHPEASGEATGEFGAGSSDPAQAQAGARPAAPPQPTGSPPACLRRRIRSPASPVNRRLCECGGPGGRRQASRSGVGRRVDRACVPQSSERLRIGPGSCARRP
jgi:hypothetical protein